MKTDIKQISEEIQDQYSNDTNPRPWIIGFSGGKDSTMLLQIVWIAISKLPKEKRTRDIYVVCNNTLVENPKILEYTERVLNKIEEAAKEQEMPISVHRTIPKLEETFWVRLIGFGYPAPNNMFRWCTDRLKIDPTSNFILEKVNQKGDAIILLGTRRDESATRSGTIKKHEIKGQRLRKHIYLPNTYVYTPIKDVSIDELWQYINQVKSPWKANNKELITLYRNANSGDCPLVIDKTTPACGNSRFGCWVCTVVRKDKSMEALVENGEEWMLPLMEFREYLVETRNNLNNREKKRRDGTETPGIPGPYTPKFRATLLKKLLQAQKEVRETQADMQLISKQELVAIQVIWNRDNFFENKVANIYNEVYQEELNIRDDMEENTLRENEILRDVTKRHPKDFELISDLLVLQRSRTILMKQRGLQNDLENKIEKYVAS